MKIQKFEEKNIVSDLKKQLIKLKMLHKKKNYKRNTS